MNTRLLPSLLLVFPLLAIAVSPVSAQTPLSFPPTGNAGSLWVHDGDQLGQLDFSSPTQASFSLLPKLKILDLSTGADLTIGDTLAAANYSLTDIAWAPDFSTMYGIVSRSGPSSGDIPPGGTLLLPTLYQGLISFDPFTGIGTKVGPDQFIGEVQTTIANAAGFVDGKLYTASDDQTTLYNVSLANGSFTASGPLVIGAVSHYSAGDIAEFEGTAYSLTYTDFNNPATTHLIALDVNTPSASGDLGIIPALSFGGFSTGFGLAGIDGTGLYATGPNKSIVKINLSDFSQSAPISITGNTAALTVFGGMTSAPAIPEPGVALMISLALLTGCATRRRKAFLR